MPNGVHALLLIRTLHISESLAVTPFPMMRRMPSLS